MPYDLYGQYYASARDAENAELAQMAQIDADYAMREMNNMKRQMQSQQPTNTEDEIHNLWMVIDELKSRIEQLENKTA